MSGAEVIFLIGSVGALYFSPRQSCGWIITPATCASGPKHNTGSRSPVPVSCEIGQRHPYRRRDSRSFRFFDGGRTRARTLDPLIKSQLLYQLSYAPIEIAGLAPREARHVAKAPGCPVISEPISRGAAQTGSRISSWPCRPACSCRSRASSRAASRRLPRSGGR